MVKNAAEVLIQNAKTRAKDVFPQYSELIDSIEAVLIASKGKLKKRNELAASIGADRKTDLEDAAADVLVGKEKYIIAMYYQGIPDEELFYRFLCHEIGHVISIDSSRDLFDEANADRDNDRDTLIRNGMALWSEFIAEVIAYTLDEKPPQSITWPVTDKMQELLDEAIGGDHFDPYPFAFYAAMFFMDPTVKAYHSMYPNAAIGMDKYDDDAMLAYTQALKALDIQLCNDDYWSITRESLERIGEGVNALWDYCWNKSANVRFGRFVKWVKDNEKG